MKLTIESPCHENWDGMSGDELRRFCDQCSKHVHDLSELTRAEGEELLAKPGPCTRFRTDAMGDVIFKDTPTVQLLAKQAAALVLTASLVSTPALAGGMQAQPADEPGWGEWLVEWVANGGPFGDMYMGEPAPLNQPPPAVDTGVLLGEPEVAPLPPPPPTMGAAVAREHAIETRTLHNATSVDLDVSCAGAPSRVAPGHTLEVDVAEGTVCHVQAVDGRYGPGVSATTTICSDTESGDLACMGD